VALEIENRVAGYLAGPTASGKSGLAVSLAGSKNLAIVSGDSMQVYRGMEIGTGALPPAERGGVSHHLIGIADPAENFNAAKFVEAATRAMDNEWERHGRQSLVVGGTGMWIQSLREGIFDGPGKDEAIRARHREWASREGSGALYWRLQEVDPETAGRLNPNDFVRVSRALEVYELSGKTMSAFRREEEERKKRLGPLPPLVVLDWPREELYRRIDRRVEKMLDEGWVDEARALMEKNLPEDAPARNAIGYPVIFAYIRGELSYPEMVTEIQKQTRHFAKRQLSWFRRSGAIFVEPTEEAVLAALGWKP